MQKKIISLAPAVVRTVLVPIEEDEIGIDVVHVIFDEDPGVLVRDRVHD